MVKCPWRSLNRCHQNWGNGLAIGGEVCCWEVSNKLKQNMVVVVVVLVMVVVEEEEKEEEWQGGEK